MDTCGAHFGEGEYDKTEDAIRALLAEPTKQLPGKLREPDPTPTHLTTPETYLGSARIQFNAGMPAQPSRWAPYRLLPMCRSTRSRSAGGGRSRRSAP